MGKIPVMPGAALGVVIKPQALEAMEREAVATQKKEYLESQLNDLEGQIREHETKAASYDQAASYNRSRGQPSDHLVSLAWFHRYQMGIANYKLWTLTSQLVREALNPPAAGSDPGMGLPRFSRALKSPIAASSKFEVQKRGFSSFDVNSTYVDMSSKSQSESDSSSTSTYSVSVGYGPASGSFSRSVGERVHSAQSSGKVQKTLVITANADLKNVLCYTDVQFDVDALRSLISAMLVVEDEAASSGTTAVRKEFADQNGIAVEIDPTTGAPMAYIFVLTEAVLGAHFAGLVNFLNTDEYSARAQKNTSETQASCSFRFWGISVGSSYSGSSSSESNSMSQSSNMNVTFEFLSQGAHPSFKRNDHTTDVMKVDANSASNPANAPSDDEAQSIKDLVTSATFPNNTKELLAFEVIRNLKKDNATQRALASMKALKEATPEHQAVLDAESLNQAFESFCEICRESPDAGVPVGWNYTKFTRDTLEIKLDALEGLLGKARRAVRNVVWETLNNLVPAGVKPFATDKTSEVMQRRNITVNVWDALRIHGVFDETGKLHEDIFKIPGDLENNILTRDDLGLTIGGPDDHFTDAKLAKYRSDLFRRRIAQTLIQGHYSRSVEREYSEALETMLRLVNGDKIARLDCVTKAAKVVDTANQVKDFLDQYTKIDQRDTRGRRRVAACVSGALALISEITGETYEASEEGGAVKVVAKPKGAKPGDAAAAAPGAFSLDKLLKFTPEQVVGFSQLTDPTKTTEYTEAMAIADSWADDEKRLMVGTKRAAFEACWEKNSVAVFNAPEPDDVVKNKTATWVPAKAAAYQEKNAAKREAYEIGTNELSVAFLTLKDVDQSDYTTRAEQRLKKLGIKTTEK